MPVLVDRVQVGITQLGFPVSSLGYPLDGPTWKFKQSQEHRLIDPLSPFPLWTLTPGQVRQYIPLPFITIDCLGVGVGTSNKHSPLSFPFLT